jgi:hypothetical protein
MSDVEELEACGRGDRCLRGGFIIPGEATRKINGKLYHEECAERQEQENDAP